jgi:hypothetical protein
LAFNQFYKTFIIISLSPVNTNRDQWNVPKNTVLYRVFCLQLTRSAGIVAF